MTVRGFPDPANIIAASYASQKRNPNSERRIPNSSTTPPIVYRVPTITRPQKPHFLSSHPAKMKVLTLNFLTCAVKACKSTAACFPLHPKDAELVSEDIGMNPKLILNVMSRIDWKALVITANELGFKELKDAPPTEEELLENDMALMKELHALLLETQVSEGKLVCGNCGHEYAVKEGIANFLLPNHLV